MNGQLFQDGHAVAELRRINAYDWGDLRAIGPSEDREFRAWLVTGIVVPRQHYTVRIGTNDYAVEVHAIEPLPMAPETVRLVRGRVKGIVE